MRRAVNVLDIRNSGMDLSRTTRELTRREVLQKKFTGNWVWRALHALIENTPNAPKSIKWYATKLDVQLDVVVDALEGLEELGVIERTATGYRKILKHVYFSDRDLDPRAVLSDHVLVSSQILSRLNPSNPKQKSFYRTGFISSNEELVREFCLQVEVLMKEFAEKSAKVESDRVVAFSFSNVKITNDVEV